jgi:hypothetical protein
VGAVGGIDTRGGVCALCRRISSVSSSSSSSVKPAMTLRHFRLLSSSSIFRRPPVPTGLADFFFWEGLSNAGRFSAAFLITWGSMSFAPLFAAISHPLSALQMGLPGIHAD